jgi:pyruvate dehydrogenase E2 component (dihydrolipoamide acetyltransferase)
LTIEEFVMAKEVIMPALGMAQETGTLLAWHKQPGDAVVKGEPLMSVATDKTDVEIEANASGVLANVTANVGDEVPVGQVIALILAPGEVASSQAQASAAPAATATAASPPPVSAPATADAPLAVTPVAARLAAEHGVDLRQVKAASGRIQKEDVLAYIAGQAKATTPTGNGRILASPKARRLAQENDINLADLQGSGPDGAVLTADVLAAHQRASQVPTTLPAMPTVPTPSPITQSPNTLPQSRAWRIMAQRLQQSWQTVPHFYLEREANASQFVQWRERVQTRSTVKITYTDLMVKVVAAALRKHPRVNASWLKDEIVQNDDIHVGLAVAVEDGLLVPVVQHADRLGLGEIAARRAEIVARAQAGKLTPDDLSGGTFTISNLGMYGIDKFNAIVNPPQAAILAVGSIVEKVVPVNGQPAIQPMMTLTLSCDHRVVDGARAAQFLQTLAGYIEEPLRVLE